MAIMTTRTCRWLRLAALPLLLLAGWPLGHAQQQQQQEPPPPQQPKVRVLILCTGNSARSQMSAGFLQSWSPRLEVFSAGTNPAARVNPFAVAAMREAGVDISGARPKSVSLFLGQSFDFVITVCDDADRNCPNFRGKVGRRVHIGFPDPAKATGTDSEKLSVFRSVRDEIRGRFREYFDTEISRKLL